ncbi:MAG: GFA family protein [Halocynthiibacter sp.]
MIKGRCDCGAVEFEAENLRDTVTICHCSQCRRTSGHLWAATRAPFEQLTFIKEDGLKWYTSSDWAKRGFCGECGSSLFYRLNGEEGIGIAAGCLDDTSALKVTQHIFVADKGNYYDITDDVPQLESY